MKIKNNLVFVFGLIIVLGLSACVSLSDDITPPPGAAPVATPTPGMDVIEGVFPLFDPDADAGEGIFAEKCAPCHGEFGLGDGSQAANLPVPVPAIGTFNVAMLQTPQEWFTLITNGNLDSFMPPFSGSLDEQNRWDVMAYVYSLGVDESFILEGAAIYQENCTGCHGVEGKGDGPESDSAADFTNQERMVSVSGVHVVQAVAPGMGPEWHTTDGLEMNDYFSLAAYVRTLSFKAVYVDLAELSEDAPDVEEAPVEDPHADVVTDETNEDSDELIIVSGMVSFGTFETLPEGITVDLLGYNQFEQNLAISAELGEDGSFVFEEVEFFEGMVLLASVDFKGATYSSNFVSYQPDKDQFDVLINIYDTTTDASELVADRMHVFFLFDTPDIVQVVQVWLFSNIGDKTITAKSDVEPLLLFDVPDNAQNLLFENDELGAGRFVATEDGFGDLQPIIPGQSTAQVVYAYELPYKNKLSLSQTLNIPVTELIMFIPSNDIEIKADNMLSEGVQDLNGLEFLSYSVNLDSAELEISLKGRHPIAPEGVEFSSNNQSLMIGIGAFVIVVVAVGLWWRKNSIQDNDEFDDDQIVSSAEILDEIVSLDKAYEDGDIEEEAYQAQRQLLKDDLKEAMEIENN